MKFYSIKKFYTAKKDHTKQTHEQIELFKTNTYKVNFNVNEEIPRMNPSLSQ